MSYKERLATLIQQYKMEGSPEEQQQMNMTVVHALDNFTSNSHGKYYLANRSQSTKLNIFTRVVSDRFGSASLVSDDLLD